MTDLFPPTTGPQLEIEALDTVRIIGYDRDMVVGGIWDAADRTKVARLSFQAFGGLCTTVRNLEDLELISKHERNKGK